MTDSNSGREKVPLPVLRALEALDGVKLVVAADLTEEGRFGERWVAVTSDSLYVLSPNGEAKADILRRVRLSEISSVRLEHLIGGGRSRPSLTGGRRMEVVRFTKRPHQDLLQTGQAPGQRWPRGRPPSTAPGSRRRTDAPSATSPFPIGPGSAPGACPRGGCS